MALPQQQSKYICIAPTSPARSRLFLDLAGRSRRCDEASATLLSVRLPQRYEASACTTSLASLQGAAIERKTQPCREIQSPEAERIREFHDPSPRFERKSR